MKALARLELEPFCVLPSVTGSQSEAVRCLGDVHGDWRRLYGLQGDYLCVVRPDAHLGLVQQSVNLPGLKSYLKLICAPEKVDAELAPLVL